MTPFQHACRRAVDGVLRDHGVVPRFEKHGAPSDDRGQGIFLRTELVRGRRSYDLYIYADEAAVNIDRTWYVYEVHDVPDRDQRVAAFGSFLRRCLEGQNPADASRSERRGVSSTDAGPAAG